MAGVRGGLTQGLGRLDSGSATGKADPEEEGTVSQARPGTRSWPISPWHAARPVRKSRRHSVCFPAGATSLFPLPCSVHGAGSRAGRVGGPGTLCHRPGARGAPTPASASLVMPRHEGPRARAAEPHREGQPATGGHSGGKAG